MAPSTRPLGARGRRPARRGGYRPTAGHPVRTRASLVLVSTKSEARLLREDFHQEIDEDSCLRWEPSASGVDGADREGITFVPTQDAAYLTRRDLTGE